MLLFLAAVADDPTAPGLPDVAGPLERLARSTGYFGDEQATLQRVGGVAFGSIVHSAVAIGGARHVVVRDGRLAAFAGRPIRFASDGTADGRGVLDAATYLATPSSWETELDGRFAVLVADGATSTLRVVTDPLGQYPVYTARASGATLVSNNARLLLDIAGGGIRPLVAACVLLMEMAPGALPLWERVETLRPGSSHVIGGGRHDVDERWRPFLLDAFAGRQRFLDPVAEGARRLRATMVALADWPGRPSAAPLSGGRDSRLVFAATRSAGVAADVRTIAFADEPGFPETKDVRIARAVAAATGANHRVVAQEDPGSYLAELDRFALISPGTFSIRLSQPVRPAAAGAPLELLHSGQNGEWMRARYGAGTTPAAVFREARSYLLPRVPPPLVSDDGLAAANDWLRGAIVALVDDGFRHEDLADAFAAVHEVPGYGPPSHRVYEYRCDTTFAACTAALVPLVLGRPAAERALGDLGMRMVEELVPALRGLAYDHGDEPSLPAVVERAARLTRKVARELRRRGGVVVARRAGRLPHEPFVEVHAAVAAAYRAGRRPPMLEVVHTARLERLLRRDPWLLAPPERRALFTVATWILATPPTDT